MRDSFINGIIDDLFDLLYPVSCLVCGDRMLKSSYLCPYCLDHAFVHTDREGYESDSGFILPDWISMQESLWHFDKGGYLQELLHHLKYSGLVDLGRVLGKELGYKLEHHEMMQQFEKPRLMPVPIHSKRYRRRGYNQAELIARGIAEVTGAGLIPGEVVTRVKNTPTQTGLDAKIRRRNIADAFSCVQPQALREKDILIVDDVITTGATVMELASLLGREAKSVGIVTVARA